MATRVRAALVCGVSMLFALAAGATGDDWTLSKLMAQLKSDSGSTVAFVEERHLSHLTEPLILKGTLTFKPPRTLEREVQSPKRESMVIEGDLLSIQTNWKDPPVRVLLSDYPPLEALITALRSLLTGDHDTMTQLYEASLEGDRAAWNLRLEPRSQSSKEAVSEILVAGHGNDLATLEVIETTGDRAVITISPIP